MRKVPGFLLLAALGAILSGCDVPAHMRVGEDTDPRNQDTHVRFRTTYYFRVFDLCATKDAGSGRSVTVPQNDTLFRFRMTGKAHPLTNVVRFESGVLSRDEIEPFGATVAYDKQNGQFYFQSRDETEYAALRNKRLDEMEDLVRRYEKISERAETLPTPGKPAPPEEEAKEARKGFDIARKQLQDLMSKTFQNLEPPSTHAQALPKAPSGAVTCPDGGAAQRGFQILGPEGWRTFDQNERLLLAMSSDAKPLISAMQELSGRILNEQQSAAEGLLPIVQEELRTAAAVQAAEQKAGTGPTVDKLLDDVVKAFDGKEQQQ